MSDAFDKDDLVDRVDGDVEFLEQTIGMLDEDGPAMLAEIKEAAAGRDADRVAKGAHAIKGMVSNFCAMPAEAAARRVEELGRGSTFSGLEEAIDDLDKEVNRLKLSLEDFVESLQK